MFLANTNLASWLIPISFGLLLGFLIATKKQNNYDNIIYVEAEDFRMNMRKGQLIDIRPEDQFSQGRINGSRNFPRKQAFANLSQLRTDQAVFLYGKNDKGIVKKVAKKFIKKGFPRVYVLKGGFEDWEYNVKK